MRLTIVTDAYVPQINGVVRTLQNTKRVLEQRDCTVTILHPGLFKTVPLRSYPEIEIACNPWRIGRMIADSEPDSLHIAVEGSLGFATKMWADWQHCHYTTSYHTQFPEYLATHYGMGLTAGYRALRWFHSRSAAVMANTPTMLTMLQEKKFKNLVLWGRGVDTDLFHPHGPPHPLLRALPRPILLNVGRVSLEKNLSAFYEVPFAGTKVQVGDGPALTEYRARYPDVVFIGARQGEELAECYRAADVFVFPSLTDTYGLVMLEAIACGTPVAAFPVTGPQDVITDGVDGALANALSAAVSRALELKDIPTLRESALRRSWDACTDQFQSHLTAI